MIVTSLFQMINNAKTKKWFSGKDKAQGPAGKTWSKDKAKGMAIKIFAKT